MNLLSDLVTSYIDGRLTCAFTRPHVMNVSHYGRPVTFDLNDPYYVMVAWGEVVSEGMSLFSFFKTCLTPEKNVLSQLGNGVPQLHAYTACG